MVHVLTKCPVCTHQLKAVKLTCESCGTSIENTFDFPRIMHLTREQLEFVEVFIRARGNIKDVEKALSISYPTVRAKLDQVIEALGTSDLTQSSEREAALKEREAGAFLSNVDRVAILERLENGEISSAEAVEMLRAKG